MLVWWAVCHFLNLEYKKMGDFEVKERDSDSFYGRDLKWGLVEAEGGIRWPESQSTPGG